MRAVMETAPRSLLVLFPATLLGHVGRLVVPPSLSLKWNPLACRSRLSPLLLSLMGVVVGGEVDPAVMRPAGAC